MINSDIISLGKPFFEEKGKVTSQRILAVVPEVQIEYVISLNGIMNGNVSVIDNGTLISTPRTSEIFYSQGQGIIITTKDGREMATWTSQGIESVAKQGNKKLLHGSAFYRTASSRGKLAFLNNVMTVFKSETDEFGNISNMEWQWK
jgi:hypothetical protein